MFNILANILSIIQLPPNVIMITFYFIIYYQVYPTFIKGIFMKLRAIILNFNIDWIKKENVMDEVERIIANFFIKLI